MELCILQLFQANFCLIWSSVLKYEIITFASHSLHSNCLLLFPSDLQADKKKKKTFGGFFALLAAIIQNFVCNRMRHLY